MTADEFSAARLAKVLFSEYSLAPRARLLVACSGGRDSAALLHALARVRDEAGIELAAAHFDHGLAARSAHWAKQCAGQCRRLDVPLVSARLPVTVAPGDSTEAAARRARYRWLDEVSADDQVVLTAHHADDQAETVLMALLQGRGFEQLSGIHADRPLVRGSRTRLIRPLLGFSRKALARYARRNELDWIEDPSNEDAAFYRNYIRLELMPRLQRRWPDCVPRLLELSAAVGAVAGRDRGRFQGVLDELAREDCRTPFCLAAPLDAPGVQALDPYEREGVLGRWLHGAGLRRPAGGQFDTLCAQIGSADFSRTLLDGERVALRAFRGRLYLYRAPGPPPARLLEWRTRERLVLDGVGVEIRMAEGDSSGLDRAAFADARVGLGWRRGGERVTLPGRTHGASLKKLLQARQTPPWERDFLPYLVVDGDIAWVRGVGATSGFACAPGESGLAPVFRPLAEREH